MINYPNLNRLISSTIVSALVLFSIPVTSYASSVNTPYTGTTPGEQTLGQALAGSQVQATATGSAGGGAAQANAGFGGTVDAQAEAYNSDTSGSSGSTAGGAGVAASDAVGCSASGLLGQALTSGLKSLVSRAAGSALESQKYVPIVSEAKNDNLASTRAATEADTSVNAFQQILGVPFGASFNGIAYCIVNGIIEYVANATIAWAKTGFKGNPAFIENPENFFRGLADKIQSQYISGIAYNNNGSNVCPQYRTDVAIALSESYSNSQYGNPGQAAQIACSMSPQQQAGGTGGNAGFWSNWNKGRLDENNIWGTFINAGNYINQQSVGKQETAKFELNNNSGWLNFKRCEDNVAAKKGDTRSCKTYTPGSLIMSSLEQTLNIPKQRLVTAEKIDQIITKLVNSLIKKALNTVLEKAQQ